MTHDVDSEEIVEDEKLIEDSMDISVHEAASVVTGRLGSPESRSTMNIPHPPPRTSEGFVRRPVPVPVPVDPTKVYIIDSKCACIKRALDSKGWKAAENTRTTYFQFKWLEKDTDFDHRIMRPGQFFNFIPNE